MRWQTRMRSIHSDRDNRYFTVADTTSSFIDKHSMYCHRATRAHNTILVNGIGQRIGTEGYGWIPRYYVGEKDRLRTGDASNAYGKVISKSRLARAKKEEVSFSPEAGWDDVKPENLPPSHRRTGKNRIHIHL